jgi:hypothetical protein
MVRLTQIHMKNVISRVLQTLKNMLKESSLTANVQVVVADNAWDPALDVLRDPQFASAVDVIGLVQKQA